LKIFPTFNTVTINILETIHRLVFSLKYDVSETGFFLVFSYRLEVGPIVRAGIFLLISEEGIRIVSPEGDISNKRQYE
jgi:hypothetical protein